MVSRAESKKNELFFISYERCISFYFIFINQDLIKTAIDLKEKNRSLHYRIPHTTLMNAFNGHERFCVVRKKCRKVHFSEIQLLTSSQNRPKN